MGNWGRRCGAQSVVNLLLILALLLPGVPAPATSASPGAGSLGASALARPSPPAELAPAPTPAAAPVVLLTTSTPARSAGAPTFSGAAGPGLPPRPGASGQTVGLDGGRIQLAPDVTLDLPAQVAAEPLVLSLGPPEGRFQAQGAIRRVFSLQASGATSGQPVTHFRRPLTLTVTYDPTELDLSRQQSLRINYWDAQGYFWAPLPSQVDLDAHTVSAQTDHFTDYSVVDEGSLAKSVVWPQQSDVNNFGTDLFGGSAFVRYAFELPPGTGGLTPKLSLLGSSAAAYARRRAVYEAGQFGLPGYQDASWVGAGFDLDLPYVEKHQVTRDGQQQDRYTLFLGGASHKLIAAGGGEYRTESEQFLKIHSFGDYWTVLTRDGTSYTFGFTYAPGVPNPSGRPYYAPKLESIRFPSDHEYGQREPFTWYLSKIEDSVGNVAVVGYDYFQDQNPDGNRRVGLGLSPGCNSYLTDYYQAVYPVVLTYSYVTKYGSGEVPQSGSSPQVRVYFNRSSWLRQDFTAMVGSKLRTDNCIQAFYSDRALDSIEVKALKGGVETLVRRYQLSYENGVPLLLTGIQEWAGGQARPGLKLIWAYHDDQAHGFTYPFRLFDLVDNGYNGVVTYAYQFVQPGSSYVDQWGNPPTQVQVTLPQVTSRTAEPGATGGSAAVVESYSYAGAAGNSDAIEPEFRGYSAVTVTEGGRTVEHHFLQGLGQQVQLLDGTSFSDQSQMKGREWRSVTKQGANVLQVVESAFGTATPPGTPAGSAFVKLTTREVALYPAGATTLSDLGRQVSVATYEYDDYGNVTQEQHSYDSGDVRVLYRTVARDYNVNTAAWIVDKVFHERVYQGSGSGVPVASTAYYYDADYSTGTPPSERTPPMPTAGLVTMLRRAVRGDGGVDGGGSCVSCVRTYFGYDVDGSGQPVYGNRTTVIDPNGSTTITSYDPATNTYPVSVTYPIVGSATATWDVGLGKPLTTTDVNNQSTSYEYDPFGRLTKVARPGDTLAAPTLSYAYQDTPSSWQPIASYGSDASSAPYVRSGWTDASAKYLLDYAPPQCGSNGLHFQLTLCAT